MISARPRPDTAIECGLGCVSRKPRSVISLSELTVFGSHVARNKLAFRGDTNGLWEARYAVSYSLFIALEHRIK